MQGIVDVDEFRNYLLKKIKIILFLMFINYYLVLCCTVITTIRKPISQLHVQFANPLHCHD